MTVTTSHTQLTVNVWGHQGGRQGHGARPDVRGATTSTATPRMPAASTTPPTPAMPTPPAGWAASSTRSSRTSTMLTQTVSWPWI